MQDISARCTFWKARWRKGKFLECCAYEGGMCATGWDGGGCYLL